MRSLVAFVFGMLAMGFATAGVFFIRFWSITRDRMFLFLATAFVLFAVERAAALTTFDGHGGPLWPYLLRLAAFVLIIVGVVDKNRSP